MPHNLQTAPGDTFALPSWQVLSLSGRDALAFAQAQFMNDVSALADRQWQWNGWLTPKGRLIALFALLRIDAETAWLLLPDFDAGEFATLLQRFVFRSKVILAVQPLLASGRFEPPSFAKGATVAIDEAGGIELDMGGEGGARTLRVSAAASLESTASTARWVRADLAHGLPRLPVSQREHWTPQQLSLDRLRAFSVKKGCYPGQEIVARTHYLGQAKRGLALHTATTDVETGTEVSGDGRVIGSVVCAQDHLLLSVVTLDAAGTSSTAGGVPLAAQPLLGGLAR